MKTFKFEFVKLSLIWRCTNGPAQFISSITFHFSLRMRNEIDDWLKWKGSGPREWMNESFLYGMKKSWMVSFLAESSQRQQIINEINSLFEKLIDWIDWICLAKGQRSNQLSSFHQQSFNSIKKVWLIDWFVGMKLKNCWIALRCGAVLSFIKSNQLTSFNKLINKPNFFGLVELSWLMKVDWLMKEEKAAPPFLHQIKLKFYLYCGMGWPASGSSINNKFN